MIRVANLFTKMHKSGSKVQLWLFSKYLDKMANNLKQSTNSSARKNNSVQTLADFKAKFKSSLLYLLPFNDFLLLLVSLYFIHSNKKVSAQSRFFDAKFDVFFDIVPKPLGLGSRLIPHIKALICGYLL